MGYTMEWRSGEEPLLRALSDEGDDHLIAGEYRRLRLLSVPVTAATDYRAQLALARLRSPLVPCPPQPPPLALARLALLLEQACPASGAPLVYRAEVAARNMYVLKHQLRATYTTLPWEEMTFCLSLFVSSQKGHLDSDVFYRYFLTKNDIEECLEMFTEALKKMKESLENSETDKLGSLGRHSREELVSSVLKRNPRFEKLYSLYQKTRDLYSLDKMNYFIRAASRAQCASSTGRLAIKRALQAVGELLKNSTDSPNMSSTTSAQLLQAAPPETRQILTKLRDSLSHASLLADTEGNRAFSLYSNVQNDLRKIGNIIIDTLTTTRANYIKEMLIQLYKSESLVAMEHFLTELRIVNSDEFANFTFSGENTDEDAQIERLVTDISKTIDKTEHESELFRQIRDIIQESNYVIRSISEVYRIASTILKMFSDHFFRLNTLAAGSQVLESHKLTISELGRRIILDASARSLEAQNIEKLNKLLNDLYVSVEQRDPTKAPPIKSLTEKINHIFFSDKGAIKWIDQFKSEFDAHKPKRTRGKGKPNILITKDFNLVINKVGDAINSKGLHTDKLLVDSKNKIKNKGVGKKTKIPKNVTADDTTHKVDCLKSSQIEHLVNKTLIASSEEVGSAVDIPGRKDDTTNLKENMIEIRESSKPADKAKESNNDPTKSGPLDRATLIDKINQKIFELDEILNSSGYMKSNFNPDSLCDAVRCAIEMLVLDILTDLEECLDGNILYMDGDVPLLTGKCLRNYLAHGNHLVEALFWDPFITVLSNARYLIENKATIYNQKFGHIITFDFDKLQQQYADGLNIIKHQEDMVEALRNGSLQDLMECIEKGANIHYKTACLSSTLHLAAAGSLDVVQFLNKQLGTDIKNAAGQTPLHIAAAHGRDDIVRFLIEDVKLATGEGDAFRRSPLHLAALNDHTRTVQMLLDYEVDSNTQDESNETPLIYATRNNCLDVLKVLLKHNKSLDNSDLSQSLYIAAEYGYKEMAEFLISRGVEVNGKIYYYGSRPLHAAAAHGHLDLVNLLIKEGADVNLSMLTNGATPLHCAVENGYKEIVKTLLHHGAKIDITDTNNCTALYTAADWGHIDIVEILLEFGANINAESSKSMTPFLIAVQMDHEDIARLLIQYGAPFSVAESRGYNALHLSAANGNLSIMKFLIEQGLDIDSSTHDGLTPLHLAAFVSESGAVETLLDYGANVNSKYNNGITPLHFSTLMGHFEVSNILLNHSANVNSVDSENRTPLHYAVVSCEHEDNITLLLKHGANVTTLTSSDGCTPLHKACIAGNCRAVELLLRGKGIEIDMKDRKGVTALHAAVSQNQMAIVEMLLNNPTPADVNAVMGDTFTTALTLAVANSFEDMVKLLIKKGKADIKMATNILKIAIEAGNRNIVETLLNAKDANEPGKHKEGSLLHTAVRQNNWNIVRTLIKNGAADLDATDKDGITPLTLAVILGFKQCVEVLLENKADTKSTTPEPLVHLAIKQNNMEILEMLLQNDSYIMKNSTSHTPIQIAVCNDRLEAIILLFKHQDIDINAPYFEGFSILHIASSFGHLQTVKYLVQNNADLNLRSLRGFKPIHEAIRESRADVVDYFFEQGMSVQDADVNGITLLHFAANAGASDIIKRLVDKGADVNALSCDFQRPLHLAAMRGHVGAVHALNESGTIYNEADAYNNTPLVYATEERVVSTLEDIDKLFEAVNNNDVLSAETLIKRGAAVNAMDATKKSLLHIAASHNFGRICDILLNNKANPNLVGELERTPLHCAAISSSFNIARALLASGAMYNVLDHKASSPLDMATGEVETLLQLVNKCFEKVVSGDLSPLTTASCLQLIADLKGVLDMDTAKAVVKACNKEGKTIIILALQNDISLYHKLAQLFDDSDLNIKVASVLEFKEKYPEALNVLEKILNLRKNMFGRDSPPYNDIVGNIANILYSQSKYAEALKLFGEIHFKRKLYQGENDENTLAVLRSIALCKMHLGDYVEAEYMLSLIHQSQNNFPGSNPLDVLWTKAHWATCIGMLKRSQEALEMNQETYELCQTLAEPADPLTLTLLNNIGVELSLQGDFGKAIEIFEKVHQTYEKMSGPNTRSTLRAKYNIAAAQAGLGDLKSALDTYKQVYICQEKFLGPDHHHTLESRYRIVLTQNLIEENKSDTKGLHEVYKQMKAQWGPDHPIVLQMERIIKEYEMRTDQKNKLKLVTPKEKSIDIIAAAVSGDGDSTRALIREGRDVNVAGELGRTALHEAAAQGHLEIVDMLLVDGACPEDTCIEGRTALHYATQHASVTRRLLRHSRARLSFEKFNDFINAKSHVKGVTALHDTAAKKKSYEVARCLLQYGAWHDVPDKWYKNSPLRSANKEARDLLKLVKRLFQSAGSGDCSVMEELRKLGDEEVAAAVLARNGEKKTALRVALDGGHERLLIALADFVVERRVDEFVSSLGGNLVTNIKSCLDYLVQC